MTSFINELPAHNNLDSFTVKATTHSKVSKILHLQNMRSDSSTGHNSFSMKFVKFVSGDISLTLICIVNNSIKMNVFLAQWKIDRTCPILTVRNPAQMKDY